MYRGKLEKYLKIIFTPGTEEESANEGNTRVNDILLEDTVLLSERENSGIESIKESEEDKLDVVGINQTPKKPNNSKSTTPQVINATPHEVCKPKVKKQTTDDQPPGTSSGITRSPPRQNSERQSIQSIISNSAQDNSGWNPQLNSDEVIRDNLDRQILETLIETAMKINDKIILQDGREIYLDKEWGSQIVVPHKNKGTGKSTKRAEQESTRQEHNQNPSRQEAVSKDIGPNAGPSKVPENTTIAETILSQKTILEDWEETLASFGPLSQLLVKSTYINVLSALKWQTSLNSSLNGKISSRFGENDNFSSYFATQNGFNCNWGHLSISK